ncbi:MAG: glycosyltransferase family 1 protein [Methanolobus sp.]|uniref:glycosyltransferase family 4 protein n=1 Tax=Methanolobus sp. TaxID=1874737 RepID=UPI002730ECA7|nr:glycosyltransferase family 1 protein [Methanolobus sp.]MDP2217460.1 glycosyltransferase family 1 protein [Methanolobus sp.]
MKILYDHTVFEFQRYGGISRYFYELITKLSTKEDVDVSLFQGFNINEYAFSKNKQNYGSYWSCKLKSKQTILKYIIYILFSIPNKILFEIYMRSSNFDLYHPTYYMKGLRRVMKMPIVITVYDMIHELYPDQFIDSRLVIKAKKRAIERADIIIAISENTKNDLIKIYGVPDCKIKVVYLASSLSSSNTIEFDELKMSYRITRPYILYVGDRRTYKNFKILIDSYRNHFSDYFDLVCFGGGNFKPNELKSSDNNIIQLHGSDDLLASLYRHAFCFVYPSLYEGFGIPPLEAMSMGCPVIASNTSSIPEVVGDAAILFDPHSEKELVQSMQSLYNESTRNDVIKRGYEQEKKFSWEKMANETLSIYKSIISL